MKTIIIACLLSLGLSAQIDDKTKHFYAGFGITVLTAEVTNQMIDKPFLSALTGFVAGTTAGILKEVVWDRNMDRGVYSNTDIGMTAWGSACGALVIRVKFDIVEKKRYKTKPKYKEYYD
jgi:hypothetical protein